MKKLLVIGFLVITGLLNAQEIGFKAGAETKQVNYIQSYNVESPILFEFTGNSHKAKFYVDLKQELRRKFKKSKFNLELMPGKYYKFEKKYIPKKKYNSNDFEFKAIISLENKKAKTKKQTSVFNVIVKLIKVNNDKELMNSKILVQSSPYTFSENKALSLEIYKSIMQTND